MMEVSIWPLVIMTALVIIVTARASDCHYCSPSWEPGPSPQKLFSPLCHLTVGESGCSLLPDFSFASWGSVQKAGLVSWNATKICNIRTSDLSFLSSSLRETSSLFEGGVCEALLSSAEVLSILEVFFMERHTFLDTKAKETPLIFLSYLSHSFPRDINNKKGQHLEWRRVLGGMSWGENSKPHGERNIVKHHKNVQFSSVAQSCPSLCNPMDCSTPGFPVHHQLPEPTQTHAHCIGDAIQPSHPL